VFNRRIKRVWDQLSELLKKNKKRLFLAATRKSPKRDRANRQSLATSRIARLLPQCKETKMRYLVPWACNKFAENPGDTLAEEALRLAYYSIVEHDFEKTGKMIDSNISDMIEFQFSNFLRRLRSGDPKINRRRGRSAGQISFFDRGMVMNSTMCATEIGKQIWKNAHSCLLEISRIRNLNSKNAKYRNATESFYTQVKNFDCSI
jgi:hypothetical protein